MPSKTADELVKTRWHVHPETGQPHGAELCEQLNCTVQSATKPENYLMTWGTVWIVDPIDGDKFTGKITRYGKGEIRFKDKEGEMHVISAGDVSEMKRSKAQID